MSKDMFNITPAEYAKMSEGKVLEPPKVPTPYVDALAAKETVPTENALDLDQLKEMVSKLTSEIHNPEE